MLARLRLLGFLPPSGHKSISPGNKVWLAFTAVSTRSKCAQGMRSRLGAGRPGIPALCLVDYGSLEARNGPLWGENSRFDRLCVFISGQTLRAPPNPPSSLPLSSPPHCFLPLLSIKGRSPSGFQRLDPRTPGPAESAADLAAQSWS